MIDPSILRTLLRSPTLGKRSVHVEEKVIREELKHGVVDQAPQPRVNCAKVATGSWGLRPTRRTRWKRKAGAAGRQTFGGTGSPHDRVTDIAELKTGQGKLHLCVVLDLFNKLIVGWSMRQRQDAKWYRERLKWRSVSIGATAQ